MSVQEMYDDFRQQFSEVSKATDVKHEHMWDDTEHEIKAVWFESLANVLNNRMGRSEHSDQIETIFKYIEMKFRTGNDEVKNCIDVCFVENLFWDMPRKTAAPYWAVLPPNLKKLYTDFHHRKPS